MHTNIAVLSIPVARALVIAPWMETAQSLGAPAEALLVRAGIRPEVLDHAAAAIPLKKFFYWMELLCLSLGTEHLGVDVADATGIEDLGHYGRMLAGALTLHQYLQQGISLYGTLVVGQSFWLSAQGSQVRINLSGPWEPDLGEYQNYLYSFAVTIANIRRFAGPDWAPTEISFGFRAREAIPADDIFGGTRVLYRPGQTYIQFPRAMLGLRLRQSPPAPAAEQSALSRPLPPDLAGLVQLQIESLLPDRAVPVDLVAESLGTSRRSLQRGLALQGVSYTDLLTAVRVRRAATWLECTDKPVMEIALDLGYTDASNFTRAFRRQTGVSPQAFRDTAGQH
jgi:AraC-like DNA-binding protein